MADSNITKSALAIALKNLMMEKPFEKISVSDICESCGMNRKSFYYHFKDKYDLVNWIFYMDFIGSIKLDSYQTAWDVIEDFCEKFYSERDFYVEAFQITGQNSFREYVIDTIRPIVGFFIGDYYAEQNKLDFFTISLGDILITAIMRWLMDGMQMKPAEFVAGIRSGCVGIARQVLEDEEKTKNSKESKIK